MKYRIYYGINYRCVRYNNSTMEKSTNRRGRPSIDATVKCTVMLEPELHAWAMRQTRTLSAMVRSLLAKERSEQERPEAEHERYLNSIASPKLVEMGSFFFGLDTSDQDALIAVARSLNEKKKKAMVADEVLLAYEAYIKAKRPGSS